MGFYADEKVPVVIAIFGRRAGLDIVAAQELGRKGYPDAEQLLLAAREGRCVLTKDRGDFPRLTATFLESGQPHAGVLLIPPSLRDSQVGEIMGRSLLTRSLYPEAIPPYTVDYVHSPIQ